jgi:hypothetical protein
MSPFDKAKYEALLEGLEISVVSLSEVRMGYGAIRLDPEHYKACYRPIVKAIKSLEYRTISDIVAQPVMTGHTPSKQISDYYDGPIRFYKTDNVRCGLLRPETTDTLSNKGNSIIARTELKTGDVLVTIIGATFDIVGRSAIVQPDVLPGNINQNVALLRSDHDKIIPEFLSTYLNSKYGRGFLHYLSRQTEQVNLNCSEVEEVVVPSLSKELQLAVKRFLDKSYELRVWSQEQYSAAESRILNMLRLDTWQPPEPLTYTIQLRDTFASDRLDAEHFQPKYKAMLAHIKKLAVRWRIIDEIAELCVRGEQPKYVEDGTLAVVTSQHILENGLDYEGFELTDDKYWGHPDFVTARIQTNDILTYTTGAKVGRTAPYLADYRALASNHVNLLRLKAENPIYVAVVMNSMIGRWQTRMLVTGSAQVELYPQDIRRFVIPFVDETSEKAIIDAVLRAHAARRKAHELLESAKRAVEIAIEESEEKALLFLSS